MAFLIGGANSAADTGYDIENSIRFDYGDTAFLKRTPGSAGNRRTWTWSGWIKRANLVEDYAGLFVSGPTSGANDSTWAAVQIAGGSNDHRYYTSTWSGEYIKRATRLFRDPSAWTHIVAVLDTTNGTAGDRVRLYFDGVRETVFSTSADPDQNDEFGINMAQPHAIGAYDETYGGYHFDGYMAEINFVDGLALTAASFGETDEDSGIWKPKKYSGAYGTNGFFLEFKNSAVGAGASDTIGADTSGNDNHFTSVNVAVTDQTTDTPTNNFCTFNSIHPDTTGSQSYVFYEGNTLIRTSANNWFNAFGTIGIPNSGKWYYEYKTTGSGSIDQNIGFVKSNFHRGSDGGIDQVNCYSLYRGSGGDGILYTDSASGVNKGSGYAWDWDDIMMVAIDTSSRKIWYGIGGTWLGSGDPAAGSDEVHVVSAEDMAYGLLPAISGYHTAAFAYINFGNPAYANSSSVADANGYGAFEYAPPSGFYALCTKNLAEFG